MPMLCLSSAVTVFEKGLKTHLLKSTQKMLDYHISRAHATFLCGLCFSEPGRPYLNWTSHDAESPMN